MTPQENFARFQQYRQLVAQGMNPMEAAQTAFPPNMVYEAQKKAAKQQQTNQFGQVAGNILGQIGTNYLYDSFSDAGKKKAAETVADKGTSIGSKLKDVFGFGGGGAMQGPPTAEGVPPAEAPGGISQFIQNLWGSSGGGAETAGSEVAAPPSAAPAATPYVAAAIGAALLAATYNRGAKQAKTEAGVEGGKKTVKSLLKDPLFYAFPFMYAPNLVAGSMFGDKDMYLKEHRRLLDLQKQGIDVPEALLESTRLSKGRSKDELIAIEERRASEGLPSNVEFARKRDESLLKPQDIVGYSTFMKQYGNDWFGKFNDAQRNDIAQRALDAGAVREHHGTIDVDWKKFDPTVNPQIQQPQQKRR